MLDILQSKASSNGRPARFVLTKDGLYLDPPPDGNSGSNYTIRGTYIVSLTFEDFDFEASVTVPTPLALQQATEAVYKGADPLLPLNTLLTQDAKASVELQWQYTPQRWRRWRRRGRA